MPHYAALDVSQETTCVCLVDETGRVIGETKLPTCPDAIAAWLGKRAVDLTRVGLETGPMAVWLWNELHARGLPVICIDARHAHAALKVRPNKTDRNDAAGLAQVVRTGWFKQVQIKTRASYEVRSLLTARDALIQIRVKLENEIRGLLRTFGIVFGKAAGGFSRRADELVAGELEASPPMRERVQTLLLRSRRDAWRGSGRPFGCRPIASRSGSAWTTSADPPSDANMRQAKSARPRREL
jgi:transposase